MLKLFSAKGTISIAVAIGLEEAGLPYETVRVDFSTGAQTKPDYLAINPKGRVPALVTDSGTVLTETGALLDYVAASAPDAGLIPSNAEDAAHMRSDVLSGVHHARGPCPQDARQPLGGPASQL